MLKKILCSALLVFLCHYVFSQVDHAPKKHIIELGINSGALIKNFIDFNTSTAFVTSPYVLTEKCIWNRDAIRCGIGMNGNSTKSTSTGSGSPVTTNFYSLDVRFGYERQIPVTEKWLFYAGADALFSFDQSKTITSGFEDFIINTNIVSGGVGPIVGVQLNFNKHIGLATEVVLYNIYSETHTRQTSSQFPQANSTQSSTQNGFSLNSPTSLIFTIRF